MRYLAAALVALLAGAEPVLADARSSHGPFLVSYDVGALVARGGRRNLLDDAVLVGVTGAYEVSPFFAVVGSVARATAETDRGADRTLLQYDVGARVQAPIVVDAEVTLFPFVAAGLGARTLDESDVGRDLDTDLTGYVGLGVRLEYAFANVSLGARDFVSSPHGPWIGHGASTRHDLALCASFGVRF